MSIKKCPKCGLPVGGLYSVCPKCGTNVNLVSEEEESRSIHKVLRLGNVKIGAWELAFIFVCNIAVVLVLINVILGGVGWCHYPVCGLFLAYFFVFASASGSVRRFFTRFRNTILIFNFVVGVFNLVYRVLHLNTMDWAFDYFIPVSLIVCCTVMLLLLIHPDIKIRSVLFSIALLFVQSIIQLLLMVFGVTAGGHIQMILVAVAFGVNLLSLLNLMFIYFIKFRNQVADTFHLWE